MRVKEKIKAEDNRKKAFAYLREKGFKDHEIAGILGNFAHESGSKNLKVDAYNPDDMGKPSFGLAQWRGDRRERLQEQQGDRMYTLEGQLDYLTWELNNTEKSAREALSKTKTAEEAALVFSNKFERPHKDYAKNEKRQEYANAFYNSYGDVDDKGVVYVKEDGKIKTKDKQFATTMELYDSNKVKDEMSSVAFNATTQNIPDSNLTNLQGTNNNVTFDEQETQEESQEETTKTEQEESPWKKRLREKLEKRNALINLISSEGFDLQFVEEDRAKIPAIASMKNGGEVKVSSEGLRQYPKQNVIVPTQDGRITMKNISYPVKGISQETGEEVLMQPGGEYKFENTQNVLELPQLQKGGPFVLQPATNKIGPVEPPIEDKESFILNPPSPNMGPKLPPVGNKESFIMNPPISSEGPVEPPVDNTVEEVPTLKENPLKGVVKQKGDVSEEVQSRADAFLEGKEEYELNEKKEIVDNTPPELKENPITSTESKGLTEELNKKIDKFLEGKDKKKAKLKLKEIPKIGEGLKVGSEGEEVRKVQKILKDSGYYNKNIKELEDEVDGKYGDRTRNAVKKYQKRHNLKVTGELGEETFASMNGAPPVDSIPEILKPGDENKYVEDYQKLLKDTGYYEGELDGKYGENTIKAVKAFQKDKGLKDDGIIGENTATELIISDTNTNISLEKEEELKRKQTPLNNFNAFTVFEYLGDKAQEHAIIPAKKQISKLLPKTLSIDTSLKTVGRFNNTKGAKQYLLSTTPIEDIRQEKNISFAQISNEGRSANMLLPEAFKNRVLNSTYPQGYEIDINENAEGLDKFEAINRFLSPESHYSQVKRLPGKRGDNREDIYRMYSGLPQKYDTFTISSFKAGENSDTNITYKDPKDVADYALIAAQKTDLFKKLASGEITPESINRENTSGKKGGDKIHKAGFRDPKNVMWNATFGIGFDKSGQPYLSFYDNWDLAGKDDGLGSIITDKAEASARNIGGDLMGDSAEFLIENVPTVKTTVSALDSTTKDAFGSPIEIYDRIPLTKGMIEALSKVKNYKDKDKASDTNSESESSLLQLLDNPEVKKEYESLLKSIQKRYKKD